MGLDRDRTVTRAVVGCPANEPAQEAVELGAEVWESGQGLLQLDSDLGSMARPRIAQWAEQGGPIMARPGPQVGPLFTQEDVPLIGQRSRRFRQEFPGSGRG